MLNIATMVRVEPMPIKLRAQEKMMMSQTAFMGVRVRGLTLDQKLKWY